MTLSKSPDRHTFQKNGYIERCQEQGKEPDPAIIQMYESWATEPEFENRPEADLEYDLRTTEWILEKVRSDNVYAQHVYASMCNMRWQKRDVLPILKDEYWSCTWRMAGGIVPDMQGKGDYIDWYCSGIKGEKISDAEFNDLSHEDQLQHKEYDSYVGEGTVTQEIEDDFYKLGWVHSEWPEDEA